MVVHIPMFDNGNKEHQTRNRLLDRIENEPGVSFTTLKKSLDMNDGTLRYHLSYLERKGFLRSRKEGKKRVYFVTSLTVDSSKSRLTLTHRRILNIIKENPGIIMNDLLDMTQVSKRELKQILKKMIDDRLIWEVENGRGVGYEFITRDRLLQEMKFDLIEELLMGKIDQETFLHLIKKLEEMEDATKRQHNH
jgi:predicted transcriptional regulator